MISCHRLWDITLLHMKTKMRSNRLLENPLQWRHNERNGVWNHQPHECLLNRLFRHGWKKTSKLRVTGFCEGNSPVTSESPPPPPPPPHPPPPPPPPPQMASNTENVSIDDVIMPTVVIMPKSLILVATEVTTKLVPRQLSVFSDINKKWIIYHK